MLSFNILESDLDYSTLWIAYSGGIDSHVLLHLCAEYRTHYPQISLKAIHINHHISRNANAWAQHCSAVANALNIPLTIVDVNLTQQKELGLEAAAREERYKVFAELLQENELLLTAHNANDQAETLLLQLLRGAGPKGLAAMPMRKDLAKGKLWRPLLEVPRVEIEAYARAHQLHWIEDESNVVEDYARNFLRQQIMPKLQEQWPANLKTIARSASHCASAAELLDQLASEDLLKVQAEEKNQLRLSELVKLTVERRANVLRFWFRSLGFSLPETKQLKELLHQIQQAKEDAQPLLRWGNVECRRFANKLYALSAQKSLSKKSFQWPEEKPALITELGELQVAEIATTIEALKQIQGDQAKWSVRFRQGGEHCRVKGRQGIHELKKLFQEWQVPPWQRAYVPLIYREEELFFICGLPFPQIYP